MQGHLPVVEYLCTVSADVNKAKDNGWTPLIVAADEVSIRSKDCMHVTTVCPCRDLICARSFCFIYYEVFVAYVLKFLFHMFLSSIMLYYVTRCYNNIPYTIT